MDANQRKRSFNDSDDGSQRKQPCLNKGDTRTVSDAIKFGSGVETNQQRIEVRNKQIMYGKNTIGYDNYLALVPKNKRKNSVIHPRTPNPYDDVSKRCFDGQIKAWRRELHKWDNMEMSLQTGVNNKQKSLEPETTKEVKSKPEPVPAPVIEDTTTNDNGELEPDVYNSDGETFDEEDIL